IVHNLPMHRYLLITTGLLLVQLAYGAFMAGLRAATVAPTWPTINGDWIPSGMMERSWFNHPINVHFIHRGLAYILFVLVLFGFFKTWKLAKLEGATLLRKASQWPLI